MFELNFKKNYNKHIIIFHIYFISEVYNTLIDKKIYHFDPNSFWVESILLTFKKDLHLRIEHPFSKSLLLPSSAAYEGGIEMIQKFFFFKLVFSTLRLFLDTLVASLNKDSQLFSTIVNGEGHIIGWLCTSDFNESRYGLSVSIHYQWSNKSRSILKVESHETIY